MKFSGERKEALRAALGGVGFDAVHFADASTVTTGGFDAWLSAGLNAEMKWMERGAEKRRDPSRVLFGVKSVVVLGINYFSEKVSQGSDAVWARYALYEDYHDTVKRGLVRAGEVLEDESGCTSEDYRYYVDTGPVLERGWAARAGLGFTGKNAMLISREYGNWLFLAVIFTRLEIEADASLAEVFPTAAKSSEASVGLLCGKCTRCMDACPTEAFPEAGVLDARKCISYHTIENRGVIPRELRAKFGARIYGCDVCAEVCPWNRFAQESRALLLAPRAEIAQLRLVDVLRLSEEAFREIFRGTAIKRVKLTGLLRNACIVAGNLWSLDGGLAAKRGFAEVSDRETVLSLLCERAKHTSPIVRVHAVWAVGRILGAQEALKRLHSENCSETEPEVRAEYAFLEGSKIEILE